MSTFCSCINLPEPSGMKGNKELICMRRGVWEMGGFFLLMDPKKKLLFVYFFADLIVGSVHK